MIEGLGRETIKCKFGGAVKHGVIQTEDFDARKADKSLKSLVEIIKISLDATFELFQNNPRNRRFLLRHVNGLGPCQELSYRFSFIAWLTFPENGLARFAQEDVGHMQGKLTTPRAIKQL